MFQRLHQHLHLQRVIVYSGFKKNIKNKKNRLQDPVSQNIWSTLIVSLYHIMTFCFKLYCMCPMLEQIFPTSKSTANVSEREKSIVPQINLQGPTSTN